jgi:hypothetical protein
MTSHATRRPAPPLRHAANAMVAANPIAHLAQER